MAKILYVDTDDEIADLVQSVKNAPDTHLALVMPARARAFQTPLNVRLLGQFARNSGKTIAVISPDSRIQEMARTGGFAAFSTIPAFERGVEAVRPSIPVATGASLGGSVDEAEAATVAVAAKPSTELSSAWTQTGATPPRPLPPKTPAAASGPKDRRPLYFAGVAIAVIGLMLFLFVAPSAVITVTITATPLAVNPVIQGTTDVNAAKAGDHILTQVVSDTETTQFNATPTGSKALPAVASAGNVVLTSRLPGGDYQTVIPRNEEFDTADGHKFYVTQDTPVTLQGPGAGAKYGPPSSPIPVQSGDTGNASNVGAHAISKWPGNPCAQSPPPAPLPVCDPSDLQVDNPAPTGGGTDAKTVTIASQGDVTGWAAKTNQLYHDLTVKTDQVIATKTNGKTPAKDPKGGGDTTACTSTPPPPNPGDEYANTQITVTCQQTAATYSLDDVKAAEQSDLAAQVPQGEQLVTDKCVYNPPQVTQAGTDGTVVLSAKATCFSRPAVDLAAMTPQFTGKSPADVQRTIANHIGSQVTVQITESPFGLPILPFFPSRITVVEKDQASPAQKTAGP